MLQSSKYYNYQKYNIIQAIPADEIKQQLLINVMIFKQTNTSTYLSVKLVYWTFEPLQPILSFIISVKGGLKVHQQPVPPPVQPTVTSRLLVWGFKCLLQLRVIEWGTDKETSWADLLVWVGKGTEGPKSIRVIWLLYLDWQRNVGSNKKHFIDLFTIKKGYSGELKWKCCSLCLYTS